MEKLRLNKENWALRPQLSGGVELEKKRASNGSFFYFLLDTHRHIPFGLNDAGYKIVKLCNGKNSVEQIAEKHLSFYKSTPSNAKQHVLKFISTLYQFGLLELDKNEGCSISSRRKNAMFRKKQRADNPAVKK
ncbi:MAG: PqqD family protein [candidate division WOR-3 bacterium]